MSHDIINLTDRITVGKSGSVKALDYGELLFQEFLQLIGDDGMGILQITKYYYPSTSFGGPVQCTYNISNHMVKKGHDVNGILVPPMNEKAVAKAIKRILRDIDFRRSASKENKRIAKKFEIPIIGCQIYKYLARAKQRT